MNMRRTVRSKKDIGNGEEVQRKAEGIPDRALCILSSQKASLRKDNSS